MKKLFIFLFVSILMFSGFVTVSAAENDAELVVTGDFDKDTKILTVHASVNNIKPEYGIIIVEYHINYDKSDLALMEAKVNMPDLWKPHVESQNAEDLSRRVADGKYSWAIVMSKVKMGIKEDEQLTIDLKFKVKRETDISVRFDRIVVATEVPFKYNGKTMYEPTEISVNDATLEFDSRVNDNDVSVDNNDVSKEPVNPKPQDPTTSDTPDVPLTSEEPIVSTDPDPVESQEPTESEIPSVSKDEDPVESKDPTTSDKPNDDPVESQEPTESEIPSVSKDEDPVESKDPITSDNPKDPTESEDPVVSQEPFVSDNPTTNESEEPNNSDVSDDISRNDEEQSESEGDGIIVMPDINNSTDDTNENSTDASNSEINLEEDHSDMVQTIIWIIVGVLGAAIVAVAVVLYLRKSKKVDPNA